MTAESEARGLVPRRQILASVEAERAVLGAGLADNKLLTPIGDLLREDDFYDPRHRLIFAGMMRLDRAYRAVDHLTLSEDLKAAGHLARCGGPAYLMSLDQGVPFVHNAMEYAEVVRSFSRRRSAETALLRGLAEVRDLQVPTEKASQRAAAALAATTAPAKGFTNGRVVVGEVLEKSDAAQKGKKSTRLIPTGLAPLDEVITGVPLEEVTIICANPAVGKTTVAAAMAKAMAENAVAEEERLLAAGQQPGLFACSYHSLEDSREAIFRRFLAEAAQLPIRALFEPGLTAGQQEAREAGAERIFKWADHLWMDDERAQDAQSLARKIRYAVATYGVKVAFVDHLLELVSFEDERRQDERVGEILRVLRDVATECHIAVVLLVHMRRPKDESVDYRYQKPLMQLVAGSEHVNRIARMVIGLWFPRPPPEPKPRKVPEPKKARNLAEADAALAQWQAEKQRAEAEYQQALSKWRGDAETAKSLLIASTLKVTEGGQFVDVHLRRILHAALVERTG
jgi:replicative DNA helicase